MQMIGQLFFKSKNIAYKSSYQLQSVIKSVGWKECMFASGWKTMTFNSTPKKDLGEPFNKNVLLWIKKGREVNPNWFWWKQGAIYKLGVNGNTTHPLNHLGSVTPFEPPGESSPPSWSVNLNNQKQNCICVPHFKLPYKREDWTSSDVLSRRY